MWEEGRKGKRDEEYRVNAQRGGMEPEGPSNYAGRLRTRSRHLGAGTSVVIIALIALLLPLPSAAASGILSAHGPVPVSTAASELSPVSASSNPDTSALRGLPSTVSPSLPASSNPRLNPPANVETISLGNPAQRFALPGTNASSPLTMARYRTPVGTTPYFAAYDPSNGYVYVANYGASNISVVNGATNTVVTSIPLGAGADPLVPVYDPQNGYIYVPESNGNSYLAAINGATNLIVKNITVSGGAPHSVTYDPADGYLYVPCWGGPVSVISGVTVLSPIKVGTNPLWAAFDPGNNLVYVGNSGSGNISIINATTDKVAVSRTAGTSPNFVMYDPGNGYVYVTNTGSGNISVINGLPNPTKNVVTASVNVGTAPMFPIYDPSNKLVYVPNNGSANVSIINGTKLNTPSKVSVGTGPGFGTYDSANGYIYVPNVASNNVSAISPTSNKVAQTFSVGTSPRSVTFDAGNGMVYAVNSGSANVSAILTAGVGLISTATIGSSPGFAAADSWNGNTYVPNNGSNSVSVFNPTTNSVTNVGLPTGSHPLAAVFDSRNGRVYVTDTGTAKISVINATTLVANITVGTSPTFATFDSANGYLYVSNTGSNNLTVVNAATNKVAVASLAVKTGPRNSTLDTRDGYLYVADASGGGAGYVSVVNTATNKVVKNVSVGSDPLFPGYDPQNGEVYVPNANSYNVTVLKASTYVVKANISITTGTGPHSASFDPAVGYVYVPSWGGGVAVINPATNTVVTNVPVGSNPLFAAPNPANGFVYVDNSGGANVTVLNATQNVTVVNVGTDPGRGTYNPGTSNVYFPNSASSNMSVIGMTGPFTSISAVANVTNATISWSDSATSYNTLEWGNSTAYGYSPEANVKANGGSVLLNYLNSNTTYDYEIVVAACSGCSGPTFRGSFATGPVTAGTEFTGIVEDTNGAQTSQALYIQANCVHWPADTDHAWTYTQTGTGGTFSLAVPLGYADGEPVACSGGYELDVMNSLWFGYNVGCDCQEWQTGGPVWQNHWNETVYVYQPQWIVFHLPLAVKLWVPLTYDFVNNQSSYAGFYWSSSETTTTSYTSSFGGMGWNSSASVTVGSSDSTAPGHGLEIENQYNATGRTTFDALTNRTPYAGALQYYAPKLSGFAGSPLISDWDSVTNFTASTCSTWNQWAQRGGPNQSFTMIVTGSVSHTSGMAGSISVGIDIPGNGVEPEFSWDIPFSFQMTMSASSSTTMTAYVNVPSSAPYAWYEFDICFQGDASAYTTSGLVAHVWQVGESNTAP